MDASADIALPPNAERRLSEKEKASPIMERLRQVGQNESGKGGENLPHLEDTTPPRQDASRFLLRYSLAAKLLPA